jgi:Ca-activated chloride channel homolog
MIRSLLCLTDPRRASRALVAVLTGGLVALCGSYPTVAAEPAAGGIEIKADLGRSTLVTGEQQQTYLRIAITAGRRPEARRAPLNVALVIDRSGSMSAHGRIENARKAAQMAVERLGRDDILAVVSYDDRVEVDVPATKLTDPLRAKEQIARLTPRGSTAIHAGLLAGANEVRKFKSRDRVNRIVLLSDGLANVGPSKPSDFVSLGRELASDGITVSTIGLGRDYNEDLMAGLARSADGGHVFVQESADLANFLAREFDDALGIVGQEVEIIITLRDGVKPLRVLGRDAEIGGNRIVYKVGVLVGGAEQVLLSDLDVAAAVANGVAGVAELASIEVSYNDAVSGKRVTKSATTSARFEADREASARSLNAEVMRDVATLVSREGRAEAVRLRDAGRTEEARKKFEDNAAYVKSQQSKLPGAGAYAPLADELKRNETAASPAAQSKDGWAKSRKEQKVIDFGASTRF